ncbi:hypothetical protein L1887_57085 [Cichorium endivia]|nr:hypothetical protein L1887_57085 [Cichorium endivia]
MEEPNPRLLLALTVHVSAQVDQSAPLCCFGGVTPAIKPLRVCAPLLMRSGAHNQLKAWPSHPILLAFLPHHSLRASLHQCIPSLPAFTYPHSSRHDITHFPLATGHLHLVSSNTCGGFRATAALPPHHHCSPESEVGARSPEAPPNRRQHRRLLALQTLFRTDPKRIRSSCARKLGFDQPSLPAFRHAT